MLYVIQVKTGAESKTINDINTHIPSDLYETVFTPLRDKRYKVQKKWITKRDVLFPGYIFVNTDRIKDFQNSLREISDFTRVISVDNEPLSVTESELNLINRLTNDNYVMEISEGIIVGSTVVIKSGPLIGLESLIVDIDRHKRKAWLETNMFGRKQVIEIGVEITQRL